MRLRLYLDEDSMSHRLVRELRARGCDIETALEAGMIERADELHLQYATARGRALLTCNVSDFCRLHKELLERKQAHAGIIVDPLQARPVGGRAKALLTLIQELSAEEMAGRLEFLSAWAR